MSCDPIHRGLISCVPGVAGAAGAAATSGAIHNFEKWIENGAAAGVRVAVAGWVNFGTPPVGPDTGAVPYLVGYTRPITWSILFLALVAAGIRIALDQRGEDLREIAKALARFVLVAGVGATAVSYLTAAGDWYSTWILRRGHRRPGRPGTGQTASW